MVSARVVVPSERSTVSRYEVAGVTARSARKLCAKTSSKSRTESVSVIAVPVARFSSVTVASRVRVASRVNGARRSFTRTTWRSEVVER